MRNYIQAAVTFVLVMLALLAMSYIGKAPAQDVKYCKDYTTGDIVAVGINMPCPYPTVEI